MPDINISEVIWINRKREIEPYRAEFLGELYKFLLIERDGKLILVASSYGATRFHKAALVLVARHKNWCDEKSAESHLSKEFEEYDTGFSYSIGARVWGGKRENGKMINISGSYEPLDHDQWVACLAALRG